MGKSFCYNAKYYYFMYRTVYESEIGDEWYTDMRYAIEDMIEYNNRVRIEVYLIDENDESKEILIGTLFDGDLHKAIDKIKEASE